MLNEKPYLLGRTFIFSVAKGEDLLPLLQEFCKENQIKFGIITSAIGSVNKATFGFYDQKNKKYNKITVDKELEILSIQGNISLYEHKPMIHAHITFSDADGKIYGGHMMSPTNIFSCEMMIQEITGSEIKSRKLDKCTQLLLWQSVSTKK
ncbi:MAG: DNA-binding protein [Elusimicrobiales bacterium]|jgi:predicted DNA-binding protein with PD1-like motif|nr:DNA-binding protein [Elusimicrobiales bacterium]NLH40135.1 DNA-binding protein [Elusimicrobiota bacterium]